MKEKRTDSQELEAKFEEIKKEWIEEAKIILETDYPRNDNQLDGEKTKNLARLQKKYVGKINDLKAKYK